jgi:protein-tyrosine phosphatase
MGFVDIHSHVLPGIDDGARTFSDAVEMLALARASGTEEIVATPHMFAPGIGSDDADAVQSAYQGFLVRLQRAAAKTGSLNGLRLHLGAENYVSDDFLTAVEAGRALPLGDSRALLLEFWPLATRSAARHALDRVQAAGFLPVVAHVERYGFLHEEPEALEQLVASGCVAQVNASAILGEQGLRIAQLTDRWLRSGVISVVASDGHSPDSRSPELGTAYAHLVSRYGNATAELCLRGNPLALLADEPPTRPPETRRFRWWRRLS